MINKLKNALTTILALATIASPAFSQTATTAHRHYNGPDRPIYNYASNSSYNYATSASVERPFDPSDVPSLTGGGSPSYNVCAGHASGFGGC